MYIPNNAYSGWRDDIVSEAINITLIKGQSSTSISLSNVVQNSLKITDNICVGGKFHSGGVISKMLNMKLLSETGLDFYDASITVNVTYTLDDDTEIVYPMGTFKIDTNAIEKGRSYISLTAYDYLTKLDKEVSKADEAELNAIIQALPGVSSQSGATYPIWKYIKFAADKCGLTINQSAFEALNSFGWTLYSNPKYTATPPIGLSRAVSMGATYRDVVSSAAALAGCAVRLDRNGVMIPVSFLPRQSADMTFDANNVIARNVNDHYAVIHSVTYASWNTYTTGTFAQNDPNADEVVLSLPSNVFLYDKEDDYNTASYAEQVIKKTVDKTLTGLTSDLKLLNADIKYFGDEGIDAGDYVVSEQTWLSSQQVGFFVMEHVWQPHASCYIRTFGTPSSSVYTSSRDYGQATRTTRNNVSIVEKIEATQTQVDTDSSFSTTEHVIGSWLDGRTIFEKTYVFNSLGASSANMNLDITDLKEVIESKGQMKSGNYSMPMPFVPISSGGQGIDAQDAVSFYVDLSNAKIVVEHGSTDRTNDTAYITLRYIKNVEGTKQKGIALTENEYNNLPTYDASSYYAIRNSLINEIVINDIVETTQAAYDAMLSHLENTLYVIKDGDDTVNVLVGELEVSSLLMGVATVWKSTNIWSGSWDEGYAWQASTLSAGSEYITTSYMASENYFEIEPSTEYKFSATLSGFQDYHVIIDEYNAGGNYVRTVIGNRNWGTTSNPAVWTSGSTSHYVTITVRDGMGTTLTASDVSNVKLMPT